LKVVHKYAIPQVKKMPLYLSKDAVIIDTFSKAIELLEKAQNRDEMFGVFRHAQAFSLKLKNKKVE
jgi:hypothetical protein